MTDSTLNTYKTSWASPLNLHCNCRDHTFLGQRIDVAICSNTLKEESTSASLNCVTKAMFMLTSKSPSNKDIGEEIPPEGSSTASHEMHPAWASSTASWLQASFYESPTYGYTWRFTLSPEPQAAGEPSALGPEYDNPWRLNLGTSKGWYLLRDLDLSLRLTLTKYSLHTYHQLLHTSINQCPTDGKVEVSCFGKQINFATLIKLLQGRTSLKSLNTKEAISLATICAHMPPTHRKLC